MLENGKGRTLCKRLFKQSAVFKGFYSVAVQLHPCYVVILDAYPMLIRETQETEMKNHLIFLEKCDI